MLNLQCAIKYYSNSETHPEFPYSRSMDEAMKRIILNHFLLSHGGPRRGSYNDKNESDLTETFQLQSTNRNTGM